MNDDNTIIYNEENDIPIYYDENTDSYRKELSAYQTNDPVCNLENGIYRTEKNIDTLLDQPAIREGEVICILAVSWDDYKGREGEQYKLEVMYQQFGKEKNGRLAFHSKEKMGCIRWFRDNFNKININQ